MPQYRKTIDDVAKKYAELGTSYLFNSAGGGNTKISNRLLVATKQRIYILIEQNITIPYDKQFTKYENDIIYKLVTKILLHLSQFS